MKHSGEKLHDKSRSGGHIKDKNRKFSHYTPSTLLYKPMFQELNAALYLVISFQRTGRMTE